MERRKFLGTSIALATVLDLGCTAKKDVSTNVADGPGYIKLKGKQEPGIVHWDVVTLGNLSRVKYWGEGDEKGVRSVICTCTVISGKNFHVMVDPSLSDAKLMASDLKRRTGLTIDDIDVVFMTHEHGDHSAGLANFPKAKWVASPLVAEAINKTGTFKKKVEPIGDKLFDIIDVIATPGHTPGTSGLRFDFRGLSVFVAGDAVANKDFWDNNDMFYVATNPEQGKESMKKIAYIADVVVPGHDNYFIVGR